MRWWDYEYEQTTPRPVRDGLKARAKRGEFSETWWGKRWIEALERFGWDTRLQRGRAYARRGQVVELEVRPGQVEAQVQGSRPEPYDVRIALAPLSEEQWQRAFTALAGQAGHAARLLAGELPPEIDTLFAGAGASLFPARAGDLKMECSCPDFAVPCKHVAAVHYLLAEEIDRDPFLLFTLRGKDRDAVLQGLRQARGETEEAPEPAGEPAPAEEPLPLEGFWESPTPLADWRVAPAPPTVPGAVLRRLGPPDFAEDPPAFVNRLHRIYARVSQRALEASVREAPGEAGSE